MYAYQAAPWSHSNNGCNNNHISQEPKAIKPFVLISTIDHSGANMHNCPDTVYLTVNNHSVQYGFGLSSPQNDFTNTKKCTYCAPF